MGGLFLIIPVVAFDVWLFYTAGLRQLRVWREARQWRQMAGALAAGVALAAGLTFFVKYSWGPKMRVEGFPIPLVFFHQEDKTWTRTILPAVMPYIGGATNILTGLVAPFIPFKVAEFLKVVKAELK